MLPKRKRSTPRESVTSRWAAQYGRQQQLFDDRPPAQRPLDYGLGQLLEDSPIDANSPEDEDVAELDSRSASTTLLLGPAPVNNRPSTPIETTRASTDSTLSPNSSVESHPPLVTQGLMLDPEPDQPAKKVKRKIEAGLGGIGVGNTRRSSRHK
jgi:hypothetical protein